MNTLDEQRIAFIRDSGRFIAFPLAGAFVWLVVALAALVLPEMTAAYVLLFGTGAIFPVALLIARVTGQQVFQPGNRFASLMGLAVLMVNLMWALHLTLFARLPSIAALSIALALGLHWIVFGWIIQSPIGLVHAIFRTVLCTAAYLTFPKYAVSSVGLAVVACYTLTIFQLLNTFQRETESNQALQTTRTIAP